MVKREHPHLRLTVTEDGLFSVAPHLRELQAYGYHYIVGAKLGNHVFLMDWVNSSNEVKAYSETDSAGVTHEFRYLNHVPLNDDNFDFEVNFFEYWEHGPNGKIQHFSWVTDFEITPDNIMQLMRGGRARWRIENETFNTLKNQGYYFNHNFGQGYKNLSTVFAHLMLLVFLVDQVQQYCCELVQQAQSAMGSKVRFWERMRVFFFGFLVPDWESMYLGMVNGLKPTELPINSS